MFGWFRSKGETMATENQKSAGEEKFDLAMAQADELMVKTRSVKEQIEPFRHADDPFAAIQHAHSLDGFYQ